MNWLEEWAQQGAVDLWVARLDELAIGDPERAHSAADDILLAAVAPEVREAYKRLEARCGWWAAA